MAEIELIASRCTGCGECVGACPFFALEVVGQIAVIAENCTACGACLSACPEGALVGTGEETPASPGGRRAIWVYLPEGKDPTGLLGVARSLAEEGEAAVCAAVPGNSFDASSLFVQGADQVLVLEGEGAVFRLLAEAGAREGPVAIMALAGVESDSDLARVAARLQAPFASRVEGLEWAPGQQALRVIRTVAAGRFRQTVVGTHHPLVVTLLPPAARSSYRDSGRRGAVRHLELGPAPAEGVRLLGEEHVKMDIPLAKARIVMGVGGGLSPEEVAQVVALAEIWGAAVGADKEAVEAGLARAEWLLDTAGIQINPALYLAFGVKGSPGHNAAVTRSQLVVAVTEDPGDPIMQIADYILPFPSHRILEVLLTAQA